MYVVQNVTCLDKVKVVSNKTSLKIFKLFDLYEVAIVLVKVTLGDLSS